MIVLQFPLWYDSPASSPNPPPPVPTGLTNKRTSQYISWTEISISECASPGKLVCHTHDSWFSRKIKARCLGCRTAPDYKGKLPMYFWIFWQSKKKMDTWELNQVSRDTLTCMLAVPGRSRGWEDQEADLLLSWWTQERLLLLAQIYCPSRDFLARISIFPRDTCRLNSRRVAQGPNIWLEGKEFTTQKKRYMSLGGKINLNKKSLTANCRRVERTPQKGISLHSQSRLTLCNPMDGSLPGSSVHGILQARILEWVAIPFSRGIFPTQGSNLGLLPSRQILYCLSHQGRRDNFKLIKNRYCIWSWPKG